MRYVPALLLVVAGTATPALAGEVIFTDGWESGSPCSWASEFTACGVGTEMVITLPGDAVTMTFMYIPPGTFWMGSPEDERGRWDREDLHEVTLTRGFWLGKYEVTQAQWEAVMGTPAVFSCGDGPSGVGPSFPVYCVSWNDVAAPGGFIETLCGYLQTTAVRLPTEAEWERAARAGTQTRFSHGDVLECSDLVDGCVFHDTYMWWIGSQPYTVASHPVGQRSPNGFGLFDMHGNVDEWTQDWLEHHLGSSPATDPTGPATGTAKALRSGDWWVISAACRSASRSGTEPQVEDSILGFRLAMTAD